MDVALEVVMMTVEAPAAQRAREVRALHAEYARSHDSAAEAALIRAYTPLAMHLAELHGRGGDDIADARQVALYGLLQALRRWDAARGVAFSTFAWATIKGELKRHRRNTAWSIHVSRSVQEAHLRIAAAVDELNQELQRAPTVAEIARCTGDDEETVILGLQARHARGVRSLDAPRSGDNDDDGMQVGAVDRRFDELDDDDWVASLLSRLPRADREIIHMRFVDNLTQTQIARRLGVSQIQVSRSLARILDRLRAVALAD